MAWISIRPVWKFLNRGGDATPAQGVVTKAVCWFSGGFIYLCAVGAEIGSMSLLAIIPFATLAIVVWL
ncbi:MAG: hypothetical protein ACRD1Y_13215 [Terriglobales bacterium]